MHTTDHLQPILKKLTQGENLSPDDIAQLELWIKANPQNTDIVINIIACARHIDNDVESPEAGLRMYDNVIRQVGRVKRQRIIRRISTVACCLGLAVLGYHWQSQSPEKSNEMTAQTVRLIDADGKNIEVEVISGVHTTTTGSQIEIGNRTIAFHDAADHTHVQKAQPAAIMTLVVPPRKDYNLILPDGTSVWLNSDSEIAFPERFEGATREVHLKGEAYFTVTKDASKPFIVHTNDLQTQVFGTQFLVCAYPDLTAKKIALVSGSIKVTPCGGSEGMMLSPGMGVELDPVTGKCRQYAVNIDHVSAVRQGLLVFDKERLESITENLRRWYGVNFNFEDDMLKNMRFYIMIDRYEDIDAVMALLKDTGRVDYQITGNTVTIRRPGR